MSNKNTPREVIQEFVDEIAKVRVKVPNTIPIPFRDDKVKGKVRQAYKIPVEYLRFRKDNGRIASDVLTWESSKGNLSETTTFGQATLKRFLELKDPDPTRELMQSLLKEGQDKMAIITVDGFLINGNRRKMAFEKLLDQYPGDERYKYLEVVILPGPGEDEPPTTLLEIEQLENRLQYHTRGEAVYYNFDKALSVKRKVEIGMSIKEQLLDDPDNYNISEADLKRKIKKFEDEYVEPLKCIDRYLDLLKRPGHYNTISEGRTDSEGRWQAFLDYYNIVYKKLIDEKQLIKLGLQEDDAGKIENIAFKIIRKRDGLYTKAHLIMRDIPKLVADVNAKKELYELLKIDLFLPKDETVDDSGNQMEEKSKDLVWGNKNAEKIIWRVKKAYEFLEQKKEQDTPLDLLNAALDKLNHSNMQVASVELGRVEEAMKLTREIQIRANELEHSFYEVKRKTHNLKDKYNKPKAKAKK
ncbi:MAG: hypothetical protein JNJ75_04425 [Cyclobacteriaceae bacterium]|nr:hypothetical protein [Cyclobacteriaceae bacterium]